jgi:Skp family chaperone for outer membrane proteins
MRSTRLLLAAVIAAAALSPAAAIAATPTIAPISSGPIVAPAPTTQGIIMRDGGICDPIRHMGC